MWVDWVTPEGNWETQEGQCYGTQTLSWRREGIKRRKVLVWWQSHKFSVMWERGKKKFWLILVKGSSISTGICIFTSWSSAGSPSDLGSAASSSGCIVQQAINSFSTAEKHSAGLAKLLAGDGCASWPLKTNIVVWNAYALFHHLEVFCTTLQSLAHAKVNQQRMYPCHKIGSIRIIPTIPHIHNLRVSLWVRFLLLWFMINPW